MPPPVDGTQLICANQGGLKRGGGIDSTTTLPWVNED